MTRSAWNLDDARTRIKLCEFESLDAAYEASFIGADFLGFHIFAFQDHREKAHKFARMFQYLPGHIEKTLLTNLPREKLFEVLSIISVDAIQLYTQSNQEEILAIREKAGADTKIIKLMSDKSEENGQEDAAFIRYYDELVDAFLLDSAWIGGTGVTGDWAHAARVVKQCRSPVFLAGGLTADNVRRAIDQVRPFGVDVENGVSDRMPDGLRVKNLMKCRLFVEKVKEADWRLDRNTH